VLVDRETKPAEPDGGRLLELSGGTLHAVVEGSEDRPPVVLLHGFAGSLRWFDRLAPLLTSDHHVIRLDLLGHGGSAKPPRGYAIPDQARLVQAALQELVVSSALIIGHSMGGAVAVSLAEQSPALVSGLVVVDEGPDNSFGSQPLLARLGFVPVLGELMHRIAIDSMVRDGYLDAFAEGFELAAGFDDPDQVVRDFRRMTYSSYKRCWDEEEAFLATTRLDARLVDVRVPCLVVFGTEDRFFRAIDSADAFRAVPGVTVELIEGAGHSPNVERPDELARLVRESIQP
jgi:pimeloyl-ACP methyl ester carboxylesterase